MREAFDMFLNVSQNGRSLMMNPLDLEVVYETFFFLHLGLSLTHNLNINRAVF